MKNWKKLILIPVWVMIILVIICAAALTAVFVMGREESPVAYAVYVLSFYTLSVVCIGCYKTFPGYIKSIKEKIYANKYGNRYMTDAVFRTHVSLWLSLAVNLLYVAANIIMSVVYHTAWFAILAGYYAILAVMRFLLVRFVRKVGIGKKPLLEFRRSRLCAIIMLSVNLSLSGAVLMILYHNRGFEYHGMLIYVMAAYTFYITTHAIVDIIKYRKYQSPIMSTSKIISLSAALVSMLSLETAMLSQFGAAESPEFRRIMIALTGAGVSAVVITMSVYMIIRANIEIKKSRRLHRGRTE